MGVCVVLSGAGPEFGKEFSHFDKLPSPDSGCQFCRNWGIPSPIYTPSGGCCCDEFARGRGFDNIAAIDVLCESDLGVGGLLG